MTRSLPCRDPPGRFVKHFAEFRPYERLVLTHVIDFLPGVKTYESTIVVDFIPSGEFVRMVVELHPMHDDETSKMQAMGFTSQLTKLDRRFGDPKGEPPIGAG